MSLRALSTVPILRIFDLKRALEFYVDYLGFGVDWEHQFDTDLPKYLQISRGGLVLHLTEHHGDGTPGSAVLVRVAGLEAFHAELEAKDYKYAKPRLEPSGSGSLTMQLQDPFGNRLRLDEDLEARSEEGG